MATGDDHNFVIDREDNLYAWGSNTRGQLGAGHTKNINIPTKLDIVPKGKKLKVIKAKGDQSCLVTECGRVYLWPTDRAKGDSKPQELNIPFKLPIVNVACSYKFCVMLSGTGVIFSMGIDNSEGELGVGDTLPRFGPTLVDSLKNMGEKISAVECGYKHVICKTSLGKVYSWGWGSKGQLGHGSLNSELSPKLLNISQSMKSRIIQVQAGYRSSLILSDDKKVYWFGTAGGINQQSFPVRLNYGKKVK